MKDTLNKILTTHTGQPMEKIQADTDRDFFMSGAEAKEYGLVDEVIHTIKANEKLEVGSGNSTNF
jgi:ATP-dependent Clp protease protease subunit